MKSGLILNWEWNNVLYYFYLKFVLKTNMVNHCKQTLYIIILPLGYCLNDWKSYYNFYKHTTQIHTLIAYKFDLKNQTKQLKKIIPKLQTSLWRTSSEFTRQWLNYCHSLSFDYCLINQKKITENGNLVKSFSSIST